MLKIITPLPKNKNKSVTMNNFYNLHYAVRNNIKKKYQTDLYYLIGKKQPKMDAIKITYTIYFKDKRKRDIANFLSIVDKFFCDAMVQIGIIKDDDFNYVKEVCFKFGGFGGERVEVEVKEIKNEQNIR